MNLPDEIQVGNLLYDTERLLFLSHDTIEERTLQVYISVLPFLPTETALYLTYVDHVLDHLRFATHVFDSVKYWGATKHKKHHDTPRDVFMSSHDTIVVVGDKNLSLSSMAGHTYSEELLFFFKI